MRNDFSKIFKKIMIKNSISSKFFFFPKRYGMTTFSGVKHSKQQFLFEKIAGEYYHFSYF